MLTPRGETASLLQQSRDATVTLTTVTLLFFIGDATIAEAILDRLFHNAHRIQLHGGKSLRDSEGSTTLRGGDYENGAQTRANAETPVAIEKRRSTKAVVAR
ncbi:MAG: ATP-binding protein [Candidatus Acidiferrales bacterium]